MPQPPQLEEEFRHWLAQRSGLGGAAASAAPAAEGGGAALGGGGGGSGDVTVALPEADDGGEEAEEGALVIVFARASTGRRLAKVAVSPVEGASFFLEGLDDPPSEVEDWLTTANSLLADRPRFSLVETVEALLSSAPCPASAAAAAASSSSSAFPAAGASGASGASGGARGRRGAGEASDDDMEDEEEDDDDDIDIDIGDDHGAAAVAAFAGEAAEERQAQRDAFSEDQRWNSMADRAASQGSRQASQVLMREMRNLMGLRGGSDGDRKALEIDMVDDSLYRWSVRMHADGFPEDCALKAELTRFGAEHPSGVAAVVMDVHFPDSFPMEPPFIRVVRPRFLMHTGHITVGGSICMQLLTPSGWLPTVSLENVFVSIRSEMIEGGGRIDFSSSKRDYSMAEAQEAFKRVASRYGWLMK